MTTLLDLFLTFARISLIAIGGANAAIPEIRHAAVDVHQWMNTDTFTHLFAVAQSAPGPNVLIASIIGWHVAGLAGLLVATIAMVLPASVLAFAVGRLISHFTHRREYKLVQDAVVPVAIGLIIASGIELSLYSAFDVLTWSMVIGTLVFVYFTEANPMWALLVCAIGGVIAYQTGVF
ncbi:chromate transporter [Advenella kashmirensis W13003]|uniref:Chromate transporter n=1 Tax=Advenella kashmirensis W13003 TaxID=1424334 RepID=V8QW60_9BURK|nr:chromate transporter [Advenella kashmirensis]ETF03897.1 chromate transporter [Advenella kashmirensis W13003]